MKGQILGFDKQTGEGMIAGEDGQRYGFSGSSWSASTMPQAGLSIDFEVSDGKAVAIYPLAQPNPLAGDKNRMVAALLALFLGGLGVHKFYLGKNTAGIIMLVVYLFGFILLLIPSLVIGVIAFVEFIIYLTMSDEDFRAKYVEGDKAWF